MARRMDLVLGVGQECAVERGGGVEGCSVEDVMGLLVGATVTSVS